MNGFIGELVGEGEYELLDTGLCPIHNIDPKATLAIVRYPASNFAGPISITHPQEPVDSQKSFPDCGPSRLSANEPEF